jgi:hypothetical protein
MLRERMLKFKDVPMEGGGGGGGPKATAVKSKLKKRLRRTSPKGKVSICYFILTTALYACIRLPLCCC